MSADFIGDGGNSVVANDEEHLRAMWAGQANVVVAIRARPLMKHDVVKRSCVRVLDGKVVVLMDPIMDKQDVLRANRSKEKQYAFDVAFDVSATQEEVYNRTTKFLIHGVLDGFNATVFAYGQTGSGKTHTMIGSPSDNGIMVRVMEDLFAYSASIGDQQRLNYKVTVSFLEVYNENIRDLLSEVEEYLDLREDPIKGPVVAGITEVEAKSSNEIMNLLHQGNARRSQAATAANEVSSRSHAVFQVVVENIDKAPGVVANIKVGKLSLVDLAGSERAANTKNTGVRLVEGANINRSLLALGNCINALGSGNSNKGNFVPYRDSKLTRLLKDSLGGNCRTVMIANISSSESSFEETLNTLKYANRAKNIKTNAQRNVLNVNYHISEYVQLITNLRNEIQMLKNQLVENEGLSAVPSHSLLANADAQVGAGGRGLGRRSSHSLDAIQEADDQLEHTDKDVGHDTDSTASSQPSVSAVHGQHRNPTTPLEMLRETMKTMGEGRTLVNQMREKIVENFQEKMQLRRSLIELEDQNVQNSIEISKRQLLMVHWSESRGYSPQQIKGQLNQDHSDFSQELLASAPPEIKDAWHECESLRKAVLKNNTMKKNISKRLKNNEKESFALREEMQSSKVVTDSDRRELMELQYQVGRLELENMELEQHRIVHESILKGKDLTIQKLQLQLAVRDKVIQRQQKILMENDLDDKVGYNQLALLEQTVMADVDLGASLVPPSPPRSLSDLTTVHNSNAIPPGQTISKQKLPPSSGALGGNPPVHQALAAEAFAADDHSTAHHGHIVDASGSSAANHPSRWRRSGHPQQPQQQQQDIGWSSDDSGHNYDYAYDEQQPALPSVAPHAGANGCRSPRGQLVALAMAAASSNSNGSNVASASTDNERKQRLKNIRKKNRSSASAALNGPADGSSSAMNAAATPSNGGGLAGFGIQGNGIQQSQQQFQQQQRAQGPSGLSAANVANAPPSALISAVTSVGIRGGRQYRAAAAAGTDEDDSSISSGANVVGPIISRLPLRPAPGAAGVIPATRKATVSTGNSIVAPPLPLSMEHLPLSPIGIPASSSALHAAAGGPDDDDDGAGSFTTRSDTSSGNYAGRQQQLQQPPAASAVSVRVGRAQVATVHPMPGPSPIRGGGGIIHSHSMPVPSKQPSVNDEGEDSFDEISEVVIESASVVAVAPKVASRKPQQQQQSQAPSGAALLAPISENGSAAIVVTNGNLAPITGGPGRHIQKLKPTAGFSRINKIGVSSAPAGPVSSAAQGGGNGNGAPSNLFSPPSILGHGKLRQQLPVIASAKLAAVGSEALPSQQ